VFRRAPYVVAKKLLTGLEGAPLIRTEVANLLESDASLVVGTVDDDGLPDATRAFGAWVLHDPERVRFLVPDEGLRTLANLADGGRVALTATEVPTHRSIQVKGHATVVEPATQDDLELCARYRSAFFATVAETDGLPLELFERMAPTGYAAVECVVTDVFDQTPGPTAGRCIT
jgi:Pyridoxamine 5'-phosphate oxidase